VFPPATQPLLPVGRSGNDLHYRGYDILDFAEQAEFEEIAYLLVHEKLPKRASSPRIRKRLATLRGLPQAVRTALEAVARIGASDGRDAHRCIGARYGRAPEGEDHGTTEPRAIATA